MENVQKYIEHVQTFQCRCSVCGRNRVGTILMSLKVNMWSFQRSLCLGLTLLLLLSSTCPVSSNVFRTHCTPRWDMPSFQLTALWESLCCCKNTIFWLSKCLYRKWVGKKTTNFQRKAFRKPGELLLKTTLKERKTDCLEAKCKKTEGSFKTLYICDVL